MWNIPHKDRSSPRRARNIIARVLLHRTMNNARKLLEYLLHPAHDAPIFNSSANWCRKHGRAKVMTILKYGDFEVDSADLPESSVDALLARGLTHYLGNEQSSKVTGWKKANPEASESAIADKLEEYRNAAIDALSNGTVGTRTGGPKLKGLDKFIHLVAVEQITNFAAKRGAKMPSGKGSAEKLASMVGKWLANADRKAEVETEAKRRFDAQADVADIDAEDLFGDAA